MATIRKRGEKWQVQVRRQGHSPLSQSFTLKSDAQTWARQTEAEVYYASRGESPWFYGRMLFSMLANGYYRLAKA